MSDEKQIEEMAEVIDRSGMVESDRWSRIIANDLYLEGYRKQSGWISVDERLPEIPGEYIVAVDTDEGLVSSTRFFVDRFIGKVTHWMPLPEPPKGD